MSGCFFIGCLTEMPAVQMFALVAGVALVINFFLQMTAFLAIFSLDMKRVEAGRLDLLCCIKAKKQSAADDSGSVPKEGALFAFFRDIYSPFLMKDGVRLVVLLGFAAWFCSSIAVLDKVHVGLEQQVTMPDDSYLTRYFDAYQRYFEVGPPVYFMISGGFNYSDTRSQNRICGFEDCDEDAITKIFKFHATTNNQSSYIKSVPSVWLDNYMEYLRGQTCCLVNQTDGSQCLPGRPGAEECQSCLEGRERSTLRPSAAEFERFLPFFLHQFPDEQCPKGGRAQFLPAVSYQADRKPHVTTSYIMTYRSVLKTSADFYKSLEKSRQIADKLTETLRSRTEDKEVRVRMYSYPDVFYEQYLTMWHDTGKSLFMSIGIIFVITFLFLGMDFYSATIVALTIVMIIVNLMGLMYWWDISLNAVSLVNLVVVSDSPSFPRLPVIPRLESLDSLSLAPTPFLTQVSPS